MKGYEFKEWNLTQYVLVITKFSFILNYYNRKSKISQSQYFFLINKYKKKIISLKWAQTLLTSAKYNHKCTKEINSLSFRLFSMIFVDDIQNIFVKNEKKKKSVNSVQITTGI